MSKKGLAHLTYIKNEKDEAWLYQLLNCIISFFFLIHSIESVVGELSEDARARIMANPLTLPEDVVERQQEVLLARRKEEEERSERDQRLAVKRMYQDERVLKREREMRELQKVFVEEHDPRIDKMAVKYRIEMLQDALKKLHEDSRTLCDFAVKARRLACVQMGFVTPAEARSIQTVHEALPMKNWPACLSSDSDDTDEGVEENGREEEEEQQIFLTQVPSRSKRAPGRPELQQDMAPESRGRKRKNARSQQGNGQEKITKFFGSQQ